MSHNPSTARLIVWMTMGFLVLVTASGYWFCYRITISPAKAQRIAKRWMGPSRPGTVLTHWTITWVNYHGYFHRDYEMQGLWCVGTQGRCYATYDITVFVNGQSQQVDQALIGIIPSSLAAIQRHSKDGH
ncbi:hypothetical protein [Sulfobacillus thermosulfidooxidans]|uniref:hypothetical protein n=1 Tax=Sulfobacillus thermosulfidooxidans TaxID=28034 RepID=UPI00096B809A|nr:hypothetical protein [Sulfobacillus thermosulfidooxidans]OLZ08844.1 hypothetical protein BFX05_14750 [Sulfobacillus thermosulfidooxidans]OLZ14788.1 hypothetical protein BFX06_05655 [Sulfobacillus thermosulfidooxidans]OLZ22068.1 hypothetical protein BFX07_10715 [Sulfobacillus thermosulfidooxidans]